MVLVCRTQRVSLLKAVLCNILYGTETHTKNPPDKFKTGLVVLGRESTNRGNYIEEINTIFQMLFPQLGFS